MLTRPSSIQHFTGPLLAPPLSQQPLCPSFQGAGLLVFILVDVFCLFLPSHSVLVKMSLPQGVSGNLPTVSPATCSGHLPHTWAGSSTTPVSVTFEQVVTVFPSHSV